jgi:hypothetical protein
MKFECSDLEAIGHSVSMVLECDKVRHALRMSTPFVYPNGSHVDVFLEQDTSLFNHYLLSDFGQTWLYLQDAQVSPNSTERRRNLLSDICKQHGVVVKDGVLTLEILAHEITDISQAIMRLSQACVRFSELACHQRLRSANPFKDDIEEFFESSGLLFVPDKRVRGPYDRDIRLDFEVAGKNSKSLVLILAAMNEPAAHTAANEIFRKWADLKTAGMDYQYKFITVYNSTSKAIRADDIQALSDGSATISYPEQEELLLQTINGFVAGASRRGDGHFKE